MRFFFIAFVVVVLLGLVFYGAGPFGTQTEGQPSPHALDQSE